MCGIVGYWDKSGQREFATGRIVLALLEALACRGRDGAGVSVIGPAPDLGADEPWSVRITPADERALDRLHALGDLVPMPDGTLSTRQGSTLRFRFRPDPGVSAGDLERALGAGRAGLEVLGLGCRLDLVQQAGSPSPLHSP